MIRRQFLALSCLLLQAFLLAGCQGQQAALPELYPATGTVKLDDKPVAGVMVRFIPQQGTPGDGAFAQTDSAGQFQLMHRSGEPGIEPGQYTVVFSKFLMPDGTTVSPDVQPESVGARQVIPMKHTQPTTSVTQATINNGPNSFDFSLKSR